MDLGMRSSSRHLSSSRKSLTTARRRRKKSTRKIVHRIFQQCMVHCTNACGPAESQYWENLMDNMSRNIFPAGFKFKDPILMYSGSNSRLNVISNALDSTRIVIAFMKKHGIISDQDQKNAFAHHTAESQNARTLVDIKKRPSERKMVFRTYATYLAEKMIKTSQLARKNLEAEPAHAVYVLDPVWTVHTLKDNAFSVINNGYITGLVTLNDCVFKGGVIIGIPKLLFNHIIGFYVPCGDIKMNNADLTSDFKILPNNCRRDFNLRDEWCTLLTNIKLERMNRHTHDRRPA